MIFLYYCEVCFCPFLCTHLISIFYSFLLEHCMHHHELLKGTHWDKVSILVQKFNFDKNFPIQLFEFLFFKNEQKEPLGF